MAVQFPKIIKILCAQTVPNEKYNYFNSNRSCIFIIMWLKHSMLVNKKSQSSLPLPIQEVL